MGVGGERLQLTFSFAIVVGGKIPEGRKRMAGAHDRLGRAGEDGFHVP